MSFMQPFLLGPVFFQTTLPYSGGYHMERGGMPLHDMVGINCKKGAITENQGSAVKYMDFTSNACHGHNFHCRELKFSDIGPDTIIIFNHN